MPSKRCTIKKDGRTIASETAQANSDAVAENAALAKVNSKVDWDDWDTLTMNCGPV